MKADSTARTFANHRGVVPILWVFAALAGCELIGGHLLLALWSPTAAWVLSAVTLLSVIWLVGWIRSWKRLPHELTDERLRLHVGSLRHLDVPLAAIARVTGEIPPGILNAPGTRNLVPMAHPNRIIELSAPLPDRQRTCRLAIRLDDPVAFDAAVLPRLG